MNLFGRRREREQSTPVLIAIAIHIALLIALATVTFRYPLAALLGIPRPQPVKAEKLNFIVLPKPAGAVGNGGSPNAPPPKGTPAPLRAPATVPTTLPPVNSGTSGGAASGRDGGRGGAPSGIATGVEPAMPDSRVSLMPGAFSPVPKTPAQRVDSVVKSVFQTYNDSVRIAQAHQRNPQDWTVDGAGGKWGVDPQFIHLGKVKIPTAVLAALPIKQGVAADPVANRAQAWMRQDIMEHAQQAISEDEFRAAVKRVRERKQREKDQQVAKATPGSDGPVAAAMPEHGEKP